MAVENEKTLSKYHFIEIFRTFRISIQPSKLVIALAAIAVIALAGTLMDFASKSVVVVENRQTLLTELDIFITDPVAAQAFIEENREQNGRSGVYSILFNFNTARAHEAIVSLFALQFENFGESITRIVKSIMWAFRFHPVYSVIFLLIKLSVLAVAGGAIARMAALGFARGEKPGLSEAVRFSFKNFSNFLIAPLLPLIFIVIIGFLIFILGLILNVPYAGEVLFVFLVPFAIILGLIIAVLAIGGIAGFNLMYPAVAYDGMDCFDAFSRAFSYVFSRPWKMAFYSLIAAIYGIVCYLFVRLFIFIALWSTNKVLDLSVWADASNDIDKMNVLWPTPSFYNLSAISSLNMNGTETFSAFCIHLWVLLMAGLVLAFVISFYFSANTIIYALLRQNIDKTAIDDVYTYSNFPVSVPSEEKDKPEITDTGSEEGVSEKV